MTARYGASAWWRLLFIALVCSSSVAAAYLIEVVKVRDPWNGILTLAYMVGASLFWTWAVTASVEDTEERI